MQRCVGRWRVQGPTVVMLEVGSGIAAAGPGPAGECANAGAEWGGGVQEEAQQYEPKQEGTPLSVEDSEKELFASSTPSCPRLLPFLVLLRCAATLLASSCPLLTSLSCGASCACPPSVLFSLCCPCSLQPPPHNCSLCARFPELQYLPGVPRALPRRPVRERAVQTLWARHVSPPLPGQDSTQAGKGTQNAHRITHSVALNAGCCWFCSQLGGL